MTEQQTDTQAAEAALAAREADLTRRELALRAQEALREARLPQSLAAHLDMSSEEGLKRSLALAREAAKPLIEEAPGTPKADSPRTGGQGGYAQRAMLYQTDRNDYLEQYKGER